MLAVPDAAPRSEGEAVAKIAEKNAGVLNTIPNAVSALPARTPPASGPAPGGAVRGPSSRAQPPRGAAAAPGRRNGRTAPPHDHGAAVDDQRQAGMGEPGPLCVQGGERQEPAHRHDRGEEAEARGDGRQCSSPPGSSLPPGRGSRRRGVRAARPLRRARPHRARLPGTADSHELLTQRRSEGQPEVEAERVVAHRFPHPARRCQVGHRRNRGDEERGLAQPEQEPQRDHGGQGLGVRRQPEADRSHRRADRHQRAGPRVGEPAGERTATRPSLRKRRTPVRRRPRIRRAARSPGVAAPGSPLRPQRSTPARRARAPRTAASRVARRVRTGGG